MRVRTALLWAALFLYGSLCGLYGAIFDVGPKIGAIKTIALICTGLNLMALVRALQDLVDARRG